MGRFLRSSNGSVVEAIKHHSRFFANARPELDFKYFSKAMACFSSLNAT